MPQLFDYTAANAQFGLPGLAELVPGQGGLPKVRITAAGAEAEIYLHGAQVTSWTPVGGAEVLFLSEQSRWEDGKAIRGGIPICFPWFRGKEDAPGAPAHGVVRTRAWSLVALERHGEDGVAAEFETLSQDWNQSWWPHQCQVRYRVEVGSTLRLALRVLNTGDSPLRFEEALHTYFRVADAAEVAVEGLDGVEYLDNMEGNARKQQSGSLRFAGQTDNAYLNTQSPLSLVDPGLKRRLLTEKHNSETTVVWNPWEKAAAAFADLGNDEWRSFACVEASNILGSAIELAPGEQHTFGATIQALGA